MFKTNTFYTYQCDRGSLEEKFTKNHRVIITFMPFIPLMLIL